MSSVQHVKPLRQHTVENFLKRSRDNETPLLEDIQKLIWVAAARSYLLAARRLSLRQERRFGFYVRRLRDAPPRPMRRVERRVAEYTWDAIPGKVFDAPFPLERFERQLKKLTKRWQRIRAKKDEELTKLERLGALAMVDKGMGGL